MPGLTTRLLDAVGRLMPQTERGTAGWRVLVTAIVVVASIRAHSSADAAQLARLDPLLTASLVSVLAALVWFGIAQSSRWATTPRATFIALGLDLIGIAILVRLGGVTLLPLLLLLPIRTVAAGAHAGDTGFVLALVSSALVLGVGLWPWFETHPALIALAYVSLAVFSMAGHLASRRARQWATEMSQTNLKQREFLGIVSHELRNPLHVILSATSLFDRGAMDSESASRIDMIDTSGRAMLDLVSELLDSSAVLEGRVRQMPVDFRIRHVVTRVSSALAPFADAKGIRLTWAIAEDIPPLRASKRHLEQVLINLGSNAIKYTPPMGKVTISVHHYVRDPLHPRRVTLVFSVADSGAGIAPADRERLFEPFSQLGESAGRRYDGVGLGLHIVRRISDALGGALDVAPRPEGGTVFTWQVEADVAAGRTDTVGPTPLQLLAAHRADTRALRCLVIDDIKINSMMLGQLLTRAGHTFESANTAVAGLAAIRSRQHDIVFLDLHMPGMSGWDILEQLQEEADVPAIVVQSAVADDAAAARAKGLGALDYLTKPIDLDLLLRVLRTHAARVGNSTFSRVPM